MCVIFILLYWKVLISGIRNIHIVSKWSEFLIKSEIEEILGANQPYINAHEADTPRVMKTINLTLVQGIILHVCIQQGRKRRRKNEKKVQGLY